MSGGHFDFIGWKINDNLTEIGNDIDVRIRFPRLSRVFLELGEFLKDIHDILDNDLSGEREIKNDELFDERFIDEIRGIVGDNADLEEIESVLDDIEKRLKGIEKHQNKILKLKKD